MGEGKQFSLFNIILTAITGAAIIAACIYMVIQYRKDNARFLSGNDLPVYIDTMSLDQPDLWDQRFIKYETLCGLSYEDETEKTPAILVPCGKSDTVVWMIAVSKHTQASQNEHTGRIRVATAGEKKQIRMLTGKSARHLYIFDPGISPGAVQYRLRIMILTGAILSLVFIAAAAHMTRKWNKSRKNGKS